MSQKMTLPDLKSQWRQIAGMDSTVRVADKALPVLQKKQVVSQPFDRVKMFTSMATRQVGIYQGLPVVAEQKKGLDRQQALIQVLSSKFPRNEMSNVQVGPARLATRLPVQEILRR